MVKHQQKQKMLLVVPSLHQGGLERICAWTAQMLQPYFDITVAVFNPAHQVYDLGGTPLRSLDIPAKRGILNKFLNVQKRAARLRQLKKELKVDITYGFGLTACMANVLSGGPGENWSALHSYMDMDSPKRVSLILKRSDKVLCCSGALAQAIAREFGYTKALTLYNPYDSEQIRKQALETAADMPDFSDKKVIVNVGREDDVKGFWHLLKSFALVHRQMPETQLMFIGLGDFAEYKKLAADLGVADAVYFAGLQKNPFPWVAGCDLFVLTSRNEGFPNALVEAMILGVPAIAVNCKTGPAEILTDRFEEMEGLEEPVNDGYGILIPQMPFEKNMDASCIDPAERMLADQIVSLLSDEEKRAKLGAAAAKRAELFSKEVYIEKLLHLAGISMNGESYR